MNISRKHFNTLKKLATKTTSDILLEYPEGPDREFLIALVNAWPRIEDTIENLNSDLEEQYPRILWLN